MACIYLVKAYIILPIDIPGTPMHGIYVRMLFLVYSKNKFWWIYVKQSPAQDDCFSANITLKYLESCSKMFENGFLSQQTINLHNQDVLIIIQTGFAFFVQWIDSLLEGKDSLHLSLL